MISAWIEKQDVGEGHRTLKEDLEDETVVAWVKEYECDYVVYSSVQGEVDQAYGRRYDGDKRDFVFDREPEEEGGEQALVIRQVVKDAEQMDVEQKGVKKKDAEQKVAEKKGGQSMVE